MQKKSIESVKYFHCSIRCTWILKISSQQVKKFFSENFQPRKWICVQSSPEQGFWPEIWARSGSIRFNSIQFSNDRGLTRTHVRTWHGRQYFALRPSQRKRRRTENIRKHRTKKCSCSKIRKRSWNDAKVTCVWTWIRMCARNFFRVLKNIGQSP